MDQTKSSYPFSPGYSKTADTSVEAAELIAAGAKTIRIKVFNVIKNKRSFGATADEVAELLNLSSFTVRPRVTELYKLGDIERQDKRKNVSTRSAYVYIVSKKYNTERSNI